ncbi:RNA methyltransferase [Gloeocapsopsis sp. IPPAS B-1203]|uniref:RNA methyltransferase n=1 Tax=Gloeocapsopsis sp. IPPAS B-1203 TaxID=2049454 RepID=UPI000C173C8C|nr:RNA methyltransferase [Gloeocapsopsis sp. IPPAS B-1203]PIG94917.1 RNA methyltransferase [Gloeocapsopsis sp. IPPAS B-1203]
MSATARCSGVRIVLVEPAGALNVGAIARVMKNSGLEQLVLVNPQCDPLSPEARLMAVHAADILESAVQVTTLPEALFNCTRAIATTARDRDIGITLEHPRHALPWLIEPQNTALIFGPEYRGLSNEELKYAQRFIRIPTSDQYPSLNLAASVAICSYELFQCVVQSNVKETPDSDTVSFDALEGYYQQLEQILLEVGYLYPHTAASRMQKFRQIFNRAQLTTSEVGMLRGILSQIHWALQQKTEQER